MSSDRIRAMAIFVRIVEVESFTAVARETGMTQPAVTKVMAGLEDHLGERLLNRTTRKVTPTPAGLQFYEDARAILSALEEAEARIGKRSKVLSGLLRIATPVAFGRLHIVPMISPFLKKHPGIKIDLKMNDNFSDLIESGVDVAIRIGQLSDSSLRARQIGVADRIVVASPDYIKNLGKPETPQDLRNHNCLVYTELATGNSWPFETPDGTFNVKVDGNFQANNSEAIRQAVLSNLGIAMIPSWFFIRELQTGAVVRLLTKVTPTALPIHAIYPGGRYVNDKARAFTDYIGTSMNKLAICAG